LAAAINMDRFVGVVLQMQKDLSTEMEKINILMAKSAIPLITNRFINQGTTAEGKSLGTYSSNPISALFFVGKSLGSGAESRVQKYAKQNKGKLSYEKFRELNNRPTSHVTLSFSGETLKDVGVQRTFQEGSKIITSVGSLDRYKKDITNKKGKKTGEISTGEVLENLDKKYGSALDTELLSLSTEEEKIITEIYDKRLQKFLDKYFND